MVSSVGIFIVLWFQNGTKQLIVASNFFFLFPIRCCKGFKLVSECKKSCQSSTIKTSVDITQTENGMGSSVTCHPPSPKTHAQHGAASSPPLLPILHILSILSVPESSHVNQRTLVSGGQVDQQEAERESEKPKHGPWRVASSAGKTSVCWAAATVSESRARERGGVVERAMTRRRRERETERCLQWLNWAGLKLETQKNIAWKSVCIAKGLNYKSQNALLREAMSARSCFAVGFDAMFG